MDLREEYKNEMESVSPDREAIDRMKAAVMAKIAAGEGEAGIPGEKKHFITFLRWRHDTARNRPE